MQKEKRGYMRWDENKHNIPGLWPAFKDLAQKFDSVLSNLLHVNFWWKEIKNFSFESSPYLVKSIQGFPGNVGHFIFNYPNISTRSHCLAQISLSNDQWVFLK